MKTPGSRPLSVFAFTLVVGAAFAARAATYYVSPNGSDTAAGTQAQPWRTLNFASSKLAAGDTALAGAGFYDEVVTFRNASSTIDGQGLASIRRINVGASNIVVKGFTLGVNNQDGFNDGAVVRVLAGAHNSRVESSTLLSHTGRNQFGVSWIDGAVTGFTIADCVVSNFGPQGVCFVMNGIRSQIIGNRIVDNPQAESAFYIWGVSNRIAGNLISNLNETGGGGGHPDIFQTFPNGTASYGHVIEGNLVANNTCQLGSLQSSASGDVNGPNSIDPRIRDWTFRNNFFVRVGSKLDVSIPGVKFLGNTFYDCGNYSDAPHVINFNHSIYGLATNCTVSGNVFVLCGADPANTGQGWYAVDDPYGSLVRSSLTIRSNLVSGASFLAKSSTLIGTYPGVLNGGDPRFAYGPGTRRRIALTGTTAPNQATEIVGVGTAFLRELAAGDYITLGPRFTNAPVRVVAVVDNTRLQVSEPIGDGTSKSILRVQNYDQPFNLLIQATGAVAAWGASEFDPNAGRRPVTPANVRVVSSGL